MQTSLATKSFSLSPAARFTIVAVGGAILTALAAQVKIPLLWTPVPVTLQTLAVLALGVYGSRFANPAAVVTSQLAYLGLGVAGLPVFALAVGATLGYVLAFPAAAAIASVAGRKGMPLMGRVLALSSAVVLVMATGTAWLAWVTNASFAEAIAYGVTPFIGVEAAKVAAVATITQTLGK